MVIPAYHDSCGELDLMVEIASGVRAQTVNPMARKALEDFRYVVSLSCKLRPKAF